MFTYFNNSFILIISTNDYIENLTFQFKNPHSPVMAGIFLVYNFIQLYLICGLIVVLVWLFEAYSSGRITFSNESVSKQNWSNIFYSLYHLVKSDRFNFKHAPLLEFLWTVFPIVILVFIAYPSFTLLYCLDESVQSIYNITVIGNQWFWTYEYNDFNLRELFYKYLAASPEFQELWRYYESIFSKLAAIDSSFFKDDNSISDWHTALKSYMKLEDVLLEIPFHLSVDCNNLDEDSLPFGYPRLLSTDNVLVIPSETPLRFLITSNDVIHSWSVPNFGIKLDAVPGRINQAFLITSFCGTSWGQCSELCGVNHGYMPIEIRVLPLDEFLFYLRMKFREVEQDNEILKTIIGSMKRFISLAEYIFVSNNIEYKKDEIF